MGVELLLGYYVQNSETAFEVNRFLMVVDAQCLAEVRQLRLMEASSFAAWWHTTDTHKYLPVKELLRMAIPTWSSAEGDRVLLLS